MTDVAKIAASLSEAQRRALVGALGRHSLGGAAFTEVRAGGATAALCRRGLIRQHTARSLSGRNRDCYALTPLGEQVKAHLLAGDKQL